MSARFVRLIDHTSGVEIGVNVDHVADLKEVEPGRTVLFQDFCTGDDGPASQAQLVVDGTFDEVLAVLNGTAGRAHPDVTDVPGVPRQTYLAHPRAIGWVQNPELPT